MPARGGPQPIPRPPKWRVGASPPWPQDAPAPSVADVKAAFASYEPQEIVRGPATSRPTAPGRRSAVLVALYDSPEGAVTILTRRAHHMRKHPGEIAFPGGAVDADETLWEAATREAHEEVGLEPEVVAPIGALDRFVTGASFSLVAPLLAELPERPELVPSPDEVDAVLHVPLRELLMPETYREEEWLWDDQYRSMHFFDLIGDTVWGATALMLQQLLVRLTDPHIIGR
ncbi:MAG: CoA pyrophosphatase [Acidimicrobiales bacterium]|nr:MAG: CoA pyrophosphatase [Acidimicrobiales bacterium]